MHVLSISNTLVFYPDNFGYLPLVYLVLLPSRGQRQEQQLITTNPNSLCHTKILHPDLSNYFINTLIIFNKTIQEMVRNIKINFKSLTAD